MGTSKIRHESTSISRNYNAQRTTKRLVINSAQSSFLIIVSVVGSTGTNGVNSLNMLTCGWSSPNISLSTLAGTLSEETLIISRTDNIVDVSIAAFTRVAIIPVGNVPDGWTN